MKNIFKKLIENIKANPFKLQLLVVLVYPILPLALLASWMVLMFIGQLAIDSSAITSLQGVLLTLGGPLGLLGGFLVLFKKYLLFCLRQYFLFNYCGLLYFSRFRYVYRGS